MRKFAPLALALTLLSSSASAAIHWSDGRPEANEMPLAPSLFGSFQAPLQSRFHDLLPTVPGAELLVGKSNWSFVGNNQSLTRNYRIHNSNTGNLLRQLPPLSHSAPQTANIDWAIGFLTIGSGATAKTYSVESMYSSDATTGQQGPLKVRVIQHPASGPVIVKFSSTFPASNADGNLMLEWCAVKDINGDGIEEMLISYIKSAGTQRIRTYLIHNIETGVFVRKLTVTY